MNLSVLRSNITKNTKLIPKTEYHKVLSYEDENHRFQILISIHNLNRGPAVGGARLLNYTNEKLALEDVLKLSKGMTMKASVSELPLGGGKAVIMLREKEMTSQLKKDILETLGTLVDTLGGDYITAPDMNTCVDDMIEVNKYTDHVVSLPKSLNGSGDPSEKTALGVYIALKSALKYKYGSESLAGKSILIQGVGKVGKILLGKIATEGAKIYISDTNDEALRLALQETKAIVIPQKEISNQKIDIFCPCAIGGVVDEELITKSQFQIICGGANNQLQDQALDQLLYDRKILYVPDYVANAGGVINVAFEIGGSYDENRAISEISKIYNRCKNIFMKSELERIGTEKVSMNIALENLNQSGVCKLFD